MSTQTSTEIVTRLRYLRGDQLKQEAEIQELHEILTKRLTRLLVQPNTGIEQVKLVEVMHKNLQLKFELRLDGKNGPQPLLANLYIAFFDATWWDMDFPGTVPSLSHNLPITRRATDVSRLIQLVTAAMNQMFSNCEFGLPNFGSSKTE